MVEELPLYTDPDIEWGDYARSPQPTRHERLLLRVHWVLDHPPRLPVTPGSSHIIRRCELPVVEVMASLHRALPLDDQSLSLEEEFLPVRRHGLPGFEYVSNGRLHVPFSWPTLPIALAVRPWSAARATVDLHLRRAMRMHYPRRYFAVGHAALDRLLAASGVRCRPSGWPVEHREQRRRHAHATNS